MSFWKWSKTAASNGTADATCPFPEGMAPSAVNDGVRGAMAALAKYRDDIAGAIVTGGSSTAYTVSSNQGFDTLAHLDGALIAFTPHATNGDTVTLNVDGLGAKPLRSAPGVEMVSGTLVQGTPYTALYSFADAVFYLRGYHSSPFNVPFLGGMDFWDTIAPNSTFIFPAGQAISRTVYSRAFARWGTTYGVGDGSTTFNVPDKTGRVSAMKEAAAARLTAGYFGGNSANMGAVGGLESNNVILTHNHGVTDPGHSHTANGIQKGTSTTPGNVIFGGSANAGNLSIVTDSATTGISINSTGSGSAHNIVQPTIVCNYIIRII